MKKIYIIDASGFLYRSYFAIRNMTSASGKSTNALFGFIRSVLKLVKDFSPDHLVAVFDGPNNIRLRKEIYPDYKANRKEMPPDLRYQIDWAKEFCELMGIPYLNIPEVEADDAMATVAKWAAKKKWHAYLASSDKDLLQIVNQSISALHTHKENKEIGPKEVEETFGVTPDQIIDYLAIVGDSSDNIPGIPGFGPKTAAQLLQEYGSLENIIKNLDQFTGKKKEAIADGEEQAKLSQQLVRLKTDVEIPGEESFYLLQEPQVEELVAFYQDKSFRTFIKELEQEKGEDKSHDEDRYTIVDDEKELETLVKSLTKNKEIAFDTETTAVNPLNAELVGIGFSVKKGEAAYIPCNGKVGLNKVLEILQPLFENSRIGFYSHNVKYDYQVLRNYGITIANLSFDTILASYVLHAQQRQHSLDALALERYGKVKISIQSLIGKGKSATTMDKVPIEKVGPYCCEDVDYTFRLKQDLQKELKERGLEKILYDLELPLVKVLADMERTGIYLDTPYLKNLGKEVTGKIAQLEKKIYQEVGEEFNVKSPKQLTEILQKLGVRLPKKTATGYSTNAEVLESIKDSHPVIPLVQEFRILEKLRSTYIDNLIHDVSPHTERIHCNFNQTVAATGRLTCQNPNLQNIPVRTEIGRKIRHAFRPQKKGWSFLSADYSQIELRLLAHLSEDPNLLAAFKEGEDIHSHTASRIFNIPQEMVTQDLRHKAKAVNFGIIYGQGPVGLARNLEISRKDAADFIDRYFKKYKNVLDYIEYCKESSRKTGKAVTMIGRERLIPEINSKNQMLKAEAERFAVNTPLQGSTADLIKLAMLNIDALFREKEYRSLMILQIHDELLFEVPDEDLDKTSSLVKKEMEQVWKLKIPLVVDVSVGKNWEEC